MAAERYPEAQPGLSTTSPVKDVPCYSVSRLSSPAARAPRGMTKTMSHRTYPIP